MSSAVRVMTVGRTVTPILGAPSTHSALLRCQAASGGFIAFKQQFIGDPGELAQPGPGDTPGLRHRTSERSTIEDEEAASRYGPPAGSIQHRSTWGISYDETI